MIRFRVTTAEGRIYEGPIQGSGGRIGSGALHVSMAAARREAHQRLRAITSRAAEGRPLLVYEPAPGCVAIYPDEDGEPVIVPVVGTTFEVL